MVHFLPSLLLVLTRAVLRLSRLCSWLLVYAGSFLALCFYSPTFLRVVAQGPGKAFRWRVRERPPDCLTDASFGQHCYVRTKNSGMRFHYVSAGEKGRPLMLMLHGFPEIWFSWRHQLVAFRDGYHVVAPDLRGYGGSDAPSGWESYKLETLLEDIHDLIEMLGYRQCVLVGHDWGGTLAWTFSVQHPEMVERLIVMNGPHLAGLQDYILSHPSQLLRSGYVFLFQLPLLPELLLSLADFKMLRDAMTSEEVGIQNPQHRLTDEELEAFLYSFSQPKAITGPLNYYRNLFSFLPVKCQDVLMPTLLIWGGKDVFLELGMAQLMRQYVQSRFRLEILPEASHWVQQDRPERVNQLMKAFLSEE
ncbi:epoxide hydrolase 3 isoform X2 [Rhinatrema bivittatum]|nr:epoxide hydrolase 3 isoform X2 [Rhinatrema bivittatum]XP_029441557.1 epoxide hydrolase 3 isoform X2 [Rhinatrema bivittatum]XP_029441558.1 epoxide hydrolase 3 isoform X2 [Rhinatrema bivittatum]XP_029441559.1 epoxide hydrolase 3 isoform X2 [Rhinatrema bivittatum]XP_029441560.1 epoxide hydrolase 3 isoform X2 [Rhinatrema bivittatum]